MTAPSSLGDVELAVRAAAETLVAELQDVEQFTDSNDSQRRVDVALDRCLAALSSTGLVGRGNQGPSQVLWKIAGDLLVRGDLQWRARSKPRGYAGDFEMQTDFWLGRECDDALGRLFDRYFLKQQAVEAVRARMDLIAGVIAARCAASPQDEFRCVSTGSGPGIDPASTARLFEPFFTTKDRGTGLGLAVSRAIARAHGGDVTGETRDEGGARFTLRLPRGADGELSLIHISEPTSLLSNSYAVLCLKKKKNNTHNN